jgi:hypothetical protein
MTDRRKKPRREPVLPAEVLKKKRARHDPLTRKFALLAKPKVPGM